MFGEGGVFAVGAGVGLVLLGGGEFAGWIMGWVPLGLVETGVRRESTEIFGEGGERVGGVGALPSSAFGTFSRGEKGWGGGSFSLEDSWRALD